MQPEGHDGCVLVLDLCEEGRWVVKVGVGRHGWFDSRGLREAGYPALCKSGGGCVVLYVRERWSGLGLVGAGCGDVGLMDNEMAREARCWRCRDEWVGTRFGVGGMFPLFEQCAASRIRGWKASGMEGHWTVQCQYRKASHSRHTSRMMSVSR